MPPSDDTDIVVVDRAWITPFADWVTPHGLRELPDDLDYDSWAKLGVYIGAVLTASKWALGDWLAFGEGHYGEQYAQAAEATGRSEEGLEVLASVSRAYSGDARELRHRNLPYSVFQELAKTAREDPQEADSILARAEEGRWTVAQTREELRPSVQAKPTLERLTVDEFEAAFERWKLAGHYNEYRTRGAAMFEAFCGWLRK